MDFKGFRDEELLTCIESGNKAAFAEIFDRHWKEVYLQVYRKVKDKHLAEELTQNLFLSLWERRTSGILNIRLWLSGAVKFAVISHFRSQIVHDKYEKYFRHHTTVESAYTPEQLTMDKELSLSINKGISLLPDKTQQVFRLSRLENHSIKEIAKYMGLSEKAVEYHITQSLKWMRMYLKDYLAIVFPLLTVL